ncbi:MAG: hypothetical protein PF588_00660, partial [Candidatus Kapabacteria bacterium]|nr:hypothetical protein [Candidatus Kapabacteria bacterium]
LFYFDAWLDDFLLYIRFSNINIINSYGYQAVFFLSRTVVRLYMCDNETLFEYGGFTEMLEKVKPTFDKIGLKININNHFEEWNDEKAWLNHRITINGTDYTIFKNFKYYGWGEAVARFAQIVNQEAEKQSVEERIYLAHGGNDGFMIFLTKELYQYIYSVHNDKLSKPLEVGEWMNVMQVKPMSYD